MPPAMEAIIKDGVNLDGFICPGHVATITGLQSFTSFLRNLILVV